MATLNQKAEAMCSSVPEPMRDRAVQLAKNILFIEKRLDAARRDIGSQPITVEYDNGGGQSGTRENPIYKSYEALLRTYAAMVKQLNEMVNATGEEEEDSLAALRSASSFKLKKPEAADE